MMVDGRNRRPQVRTILHPARQDVAQVPIPRVLDLVVRRAGQPQDSKITAGFWAKKCEISLYLCGFYGIGEVSHGAGKVSPPARL